MNELHTQSGLDTVLNKGLYVPSVESLKFIAFIRAAGLEGNVSPEAHYKIGDALFSKDKKDWNLLIECLRGMGKSTVVEYAVIYICALGYWPNFGACPFIVFLGASQEGNTKAFFKNIAGKIFASEFLMSLFKLDSKNYRQTDSEMELVNSEGVLTFIAGRGMSVNWRGARSPSGARVSVLIADDVLTNESMTSETIRNTVETNWFNSALPALEPSKHKIIYIGTPLSEADLLHKLKNSGTYTLIQFPLCDKFPCSEAEFKSVWPDRFTYEYVTRMFDQYKGAGRTQSFYQEYMLEVTDLATLIIDEEDINWFDYSIFLKNKAKYNYYVVTDFATSTKKSADYSTIGVIAVSSNNDWLLVDGQCKRQTMQENIDDLFAYATKWKPIYVGIETSGQQGGFISIMQDMMMERNVWFQFARKQGSKELGIRPAKDKVSRFVKGVQPKFKQGKVWFPRPDTIPISLFRLTELLDEMVNELSKFTMAGGVAALKHDDAIDLLNQFSEMEIYAPTEDSPESLNAPTAVSHAYWGAFPGENDEENSWGNTIF